MSSSLIGTVFRAVVIAGALAASGYAVMLPLTARSGEISRMEALKPNYAGDSTGGGTIGIPAK